MGLGDRGHGEVADHSWSEDEAMGGASELEVSELVALGDMVPRLDTRVDETGTDLGHTDRYETDQSNGGIVGPDEEDRPGGHVGKVARGVGRLYRV
jgi:hypothetical protein